MRVRRQHCSHVLTLTGAAQPFFRSLASSAVPLLNGPGSDAPSSRAAKVESSASV